MPEANEAALQRAVAAIAQSDPLIKLLQQVTLGRMKPTDAGLRAVTESWVKTYQKVIEASALRRSELVRLDPGPRLDVLIEAGVLDPSNEAQRSLRLTFERKMAQAGLD